MKISKEAFISQQGGRNKTLAEGLLSGIDASEFLAKNYAPTIIVEMGHKIRRKVEGMEDFVFTLEVKKEVIQPDPTNTEDDKLIGIATGAKKNHVTQTYTNAPLEGGCCEG